MGHSGTGRRCAGDELNPYPQTLVCNYRVRGGQHQEQCSSPTPCNAISLLLRFPFKTPARALCAAPRRPRSPPAGQQPPIAFPLRAASSPGVIPGQHRASRRFCSSSAEFTPRSGSVVALAAPAAPERLNFSKLSPHPPLQGWTLAEGQGPPPLRSTALGHTDSSSQGRERRISSSAVGKGRGRRTRSPFGLRRARRCLQQRVTSS